MEGRKALTSPDNPSGTGLTSPRRLTGDVTQPTGAVAVANGKRTAVDLRLVRVNGLSAPRNVVMVYLKITRRNATTSDARCRQRRSTASGSGILVNIIFAQCAR